MLLRPRSSLSEVFHSQRDVIRVQLMLLNHTECLMNEPDWASSPTTWKKKTQLNQNHTLIQRKILTIKRFKYMYIINVSLFKTTLVWRALLKHNTRTNPKAGLYVWREDFLKSLSKLRSDEQTLSSRSRSWKLDISPVLFSTRSSKESGSGWNATGVYPLCL